MLLIGIPLLATPVGAAEGVRAHTGTLDLPTYEWTAVKHPYFRGTDRVNIYPYPMLDFLSREKTNRTYQTVVLENEYLRVTFLPELGGKIHEVIDKTTGQPMFYVNHVIKPGLIGQCGAWTSGGVEWNTGPQGHTVSCMLPVEVRILPPEKDGSRSVAIGETERIYGTRWTVVVTLRPGRSFLEERIRIYNPTETIRPYYFWNCTAAPNTPGFRFIYPMTLGMDHSGDKFFQWPVHEGKDLTRGTNYQDASSIFAYHCDQDFFGSYEDDLDRGVVSFANHHQLPGKKAWTWGYGGFGTMHQADLTDTDGPYNEVQTGPLLTQGEVGRLDPCEAVEWREWWYPVHAIGGFTFANRNLAANVSVQHGQVRLRLLGTGSWSDVRVELGKAGRLLHAGECRLDPRQPVDLSLPAGGEAEPFHISISRGQLSLASFQFPLDLPVRQIPEKRPDPKSASEYVEAGWQHFLFARFSEADAQFRKALAQDAANPDAYTGLAYLNLDSDPALAVTNARAALAISPDTGKARYALAVAECRLGHESTALEEAWRAALDPAVASAARALVAKLLLRRQDFAGAIAALSPAGPWTSDPLCRNRLALASLKRHEAAAGTRSAKVEARADRSLAGSLAQQNLDLDPLDLMARHLWVRAEAGSGDESPRWLPPATTRRQALLDLLADYSEVGETGTAVLGLSRETLNPASGYLEPGPLPYRAETVTALRRALEAKPKDGQAMLELGHLLFHLGRHAEGRALWEQGAASGADPVVAWRALGMAAKTLDSDLDKARAWLEKANQADRFDAIVARDLAKVLFDLADKAEPENQKRDLTTQARDCLQAAFAAGKGRSDFVALLARAQSRLGEFTAMAQMLDRVRVTVWEGAHEVHDLFEQAHLALGEDHLKANRPAEALAEFNRALEYPANLATGKLENARQAHIHYQRGNALAVLGRPAEARAAWRLAADEPESKEEKIETARQKAKAALAGTPGNK